MIRSLVGFVIVAGSLLRAGFAAAETAALNLERRASVAGGVFVDRANARVLLDGREIARLVGVRGDRMLLSQGIRFVSEIESSDGADLSRTAAASARRSAAPRVRAYLEIEPR